MAKRKSKSGNYQIGNEKEYNAAMDKIDALMKKGEAGLTEIESEALRLLAVAAQTYEKTIYSIPAPKTLEGLIELKMYERKLKQKELEQFAARAGKKWLRLNVDFHKENLAASKEAITNIRKHAEKSLEIVERLRKNLIDDMQTSYDNAVKNQLDKQEALKRGAMDGL